MGGFERIVKPHFSTASCAGFSPIELRRFSWGVVSYRSAWCEPARETQWRQMQPFYGSFVFITPLISLTNFILLLYTCKSTVTQKRTLAKLGCLSANILHRLWSEVETGMKTTTALTPSAPRKIPLSANWNMSDRNNFQHLVSGARTESISSTCASCHFSSRFRCRVTSLSVFLSYEPFKITWQVKSMTLDPTEDYIQIKNTE